MSKGKRQVTILLDGELVKELERLRDETGLPLSKIIELKLKGYEIVKREDREKKLS
ncbi:MAG TPA: ribbon-helix-helix domain-containing protein [Thermofilum sp.]|nr:ribbon-helix-helix domain-containing protein [Thermofilum sp.]